MAKKDIVPQHQHRWGACQKILGQNKRLRQPVRGRLDNIFQPDAKLRAVAQHAFELFLICGCGNHCNLAQPRQHQHRQRVIDHRLVIDRQQLLGHAQCDRVKPGARPACQNDAFALCHKSAFTISRVAARQSGRSMSKARKSEEQSIREFNGRTAGVG